MLIKTIKVLYIHHSGVFGGASRSLLELITAFPATAIKPIVLLPNGNAVNAFKKQNIITIPVKGLSQFDNTSYGYYRNTRWLVLLREIMLLPFTYRSLKKAEKNINDGVDLIHINEITNLPSIILASKIFKKPVILHVRSLQRNPEGVRNKLIYKLINRYVASIIAIDETVNHSLSEECKSIVIHNGFDPQSAINDADNNVENHLGKLGGKLKLVIVGNILYMKGIVEFMKAAKLCKERGLSVDFIIVGDKPSTPKTIWSALLNVLKLSHDAKEFVLDFIGTNHLETMIHLIPFTPNITNIYEHCDVLCFPSHLNAVGRPVFEAAFLKKPSIVAIENPLADTIIPMQTGICIAEKSPEELFKAIKYFYDKPDEIIRMGEQAYNLANQNFNIKNNAIKVLQLYKSLLN